MSTSILSVTQLNSYVKLQLESDTKLNNVFVCGEISNFNNNYRSGHLYFSLKDSNALVKAVMFVSSASRLRFTPTDGMRVIVTGRVTVYEATGQYQLIVNSMQPDGVGALTLAYEQLKNKLEEQGLFREEHKLALPYFPNSIGVITSPTGAVIQDIKNVMSRRCPVTQLVLCPVQVQGELASEQLVKAVRLFNQLDNVDVIIIGRGGGSFEDLNSFNSESLVKEIYNSHIPIISAVGHETDFTLCDFVSDLRAPTPSAAAELAVPDKYELTKYTGDLFTTIKQSVISNIAYQQQSIDLLSEKVGLSGMADFFSSERNSIKSAYKYISNYIDNFLKLEKMALGRVTDRVNDLNPINVLKRGFSVVGKDDKTVTSVSSLSVSDNINVKMLDGSINCTVNEIKKNNLR